MRVQVRRESRSHGRSNEISINPLSAGSRFDSVPVRSTISPDHSSDLTFVSRRINTVKGVKRARIRVYIRDRP